MSASDSDREYFKRIAIKNRKLSTESAPESLQEAFNRMDQIEQRLGDLVDGRSAADAEGDLKSHLSYLKRLRTLGRR